MRPIDLSALGYRFYRLVVLRGEVILPVCGGRLASLCETSDLTAPSKIGGNALISRWTSIRIGLTAEKNVDTTVDAARLEARATKCSFENTIGGTQRHLDFHGSRVGDRPMDTLDSRGSFSRLESRDDRDGGERW
jgi:hypothetical protein